MNKHFLISTATILLLVFTCQVNADSNPATKKKVLYVDSYHAGYPWSEGILQGILETFNIKLRKEMAVDESSLVHLKIVRMDTKKNGTKSFKEAAALKVQAVIDQWQPDIVIASDDNASQFLIMPFYKNASLPFVFCGVNWDVSAYGFPYDNVTGMLEVSLIAQLVETMQKYAQGTRLAILGADNISNRKEAEHYKKILPVPLVKEIFVNNFEEWKEEYLKLQNEADMLILAPPSFLQSENDILEAKKFVLRNTSIITGSVEDWITPFSLFGFTKVPQEQGEWAARTALEILNGKSPSEIPLAKNKKSKIFLNMALAKKLQIKFPMELIKISTFVKPE